MNMLVSVNCYIASTSCIFVFSFSGSVYFDVKKYGKYGQFAIQKDDQGL